MPLPLPLPLPNSGSGEGQLGPTFLPSFSAGPRLYSSLTCAVGWWPGILVTAVATVVHAPEIAHQARGDAPAIPTAEVGTTGTWDQKGKHVMRTSGQPLTSRMCGPIVRGCGRCGEESRKENFTGHRCITMTTTLMVMGDRCVATMMPLVVMGDRCITMMMSLMVMGYRCVTIMLTMMMVVAN